MSCLTSCWMTYNLAGFDLATRDSYLTILVDVFHEPCFSRDTYFTNCIEWTEHTIIVLNPANKHQITRQYHNFRTILINDFFMSKSKIFENITFYGAENDKCYVATINYSNLYLLFDLLKHQKNIS